MKRFSVIITTYNAQKTILRLINSIFSQKGINEKFEIELIVVDDCSIDNTTAILKNNNIHFISTNKNTGGPNTGRNIGLKKATGEFICIADHDDEWHDNRLETILPFLEMAPIVTSGFCVKDSISGKIQNRQHIRKNDLDYILYEKNKTFLSKLSKSNNGQITYLGSIVYHKELKNVYFEEEYGQLDFDWLVSIFEGNSSVEVCKTLYTRHVEGGNLSLNENYRLRDFQFSLNFIQKYARNYPNETKVARLKLHGSLARFYYLLGNMKQARKYFLKSSLNFKTVMYFLTTFAGSKFIKKHFNVFG